MPRPMKREMSKIVDKNGRCLCGAKLNRALFIEFKQTTKKNKDSVSEIFESAMKKYLDGVQSPGKCMEVKL